MPRFFLHLHNKDSVIEDPEGAEFIDLAEALDEAELSAREIMSSRIGKGFRLDNSSFAIANEAGDIVAVVQFEDILSDDPRKIAPPLLKWLEH